MVKNGFSEEEIWATCGKFMRIIFVDKYKYWQASVMLALASGANYDNDVTWNNVKHFQNSIVTKSEVNYKRSSVLWNEFITELLILTALIYVIFSCKRNWYLSKLDWVFFIIPRFCNKYLYSFEIYLCIKLLKLDWSICTALLTHLCSVFAFHTS